MKKVCGVIGILMLLSFITTNLFAQTVFKDAYALHGDKYSSGRIIQKSTSGNIYITGTLAGRIDADPGAGTVYLEGDTNYQYGNQIQFYLASYDEQQNHLWSGVLDNAVDSSVMHIAEILPDRDDNLYVAGSFEGKMDFDLSQDTFYLTSNKTTGFIAKYDSQGSLVWAFLPTDGAPSTIADMALRDHLVGEDQLYIIGNATNTNIGGINTIDFDPGIGVYNVVPEIDSTGGLAFTAKYTSTSALVWADALDQGVAYHQTITCDDNGDIIIAGRHFSYTQSVDLDMGTGFFKLGKIGYGSVGYIARYDSTGGFKRAFGVLGWSYTNGNSTTHYPIWFRDVAIDGEGEIVVVCDIHKGIDIDPSANTIFIDNVGGDILAKFSTEGQYRWHHIIPGLSRMGVDNDNAVIIASGEEVRKYSNNGILMCTDEYSTINFLSGVYPADIVVYDSSMVLSTGSFRNLIDFDMGAGEHIISAEGTGDSYVALHQLPCQSLLPCELEAKIGYWSAGSYYSFKGDNSTFYTGKRSYYWDFGDGETDTVPNPGHTFDSIGHFNVCLIISDNCGSDTTCKVIKNCNYSNANFTWQQAGPNKIAFKDTSISVDAITYSWNFGDGNTSTAQHPQHTYTTPGTYQVCLTINDGCDVDIRCKNVFVDSLGCAPMAHFNYNPDTLTVSFTNLSQTTGNTSWLWDFGDGNTSLLENPVHSFDSAGVYNVCLIVEDSCWVDTFCREIILNPCFAPEAMFSGYHSYLNFYANNQSNFTGITSWLWDFGDGTTSTLKNPNHSFDNAGTYTICLIVTDSCGTDTFCDNRTFIAPPPCTPGVGLEYYVGCDNQLKLKAHITSSSSITSYQWEYGDGNTSGQVYTAPSPNPVPPYYQVTNTHLYDSAGTYEVCLTLENACGSKTKCWTITVPTPPVPCIAPTASFRTESDSLDFHFYDGSLSKTNITSWHWDFGDGTTSNLQHPSHTYVDSFATYEVCLIVNDSCGADTFCNYTIVLPQKKCNYQRPSFTYQKEDGLTYNFLNESEVHVNANWYWDFGDGNTSNLPNPVHEYATWGTYTVCLKYTDNCKTDSTCRNAWIPKPSPNCVKPIAHFEYEVDTALGVQFYNHGIYCNLDSNIEAFSWDFGDGTSSNMEHPLHVYSSPGIYQVCFILTNACGSDTICREVIVTDGCQQIADFYVEITNGQSVQFWNTSLSADSLTHYIWRFGDGTYDTTAYPVHVYTQLGIYTVCLELWSSCGADTICKEITICPLPVADFTATINDLEAGFSSTIANSDSNTTVIWDFGDGSTSFLPHPTHTYGQAGTYEVCLLVTNTCGADTICKDVVITNGGGCVDPVASFNFALDAFNCLKVNFENNGSQQTGNASYIWYFGDSLIDTGAVVTHTYATAGQYLVCLLVVDNCGVDTSCKVVTVGCTSVDDIYGIDDRIKVYPNPTKDVLNVENLTGDVINVQMIDMIGNIVLERKVDKSQKLDVSDLSSGIYSLKSYGQNVTYIRKVLVH